MRNTHTRQSGVFKTTKRILSTSADLLEDSILLAREELSASLIANRDENTADIAVNKISLLRELKATQKEELDSDEQEILAYAISAIKANRRI